MRYILAIASGIVIAGLNKKVRREGSGTSLFDILAIAAGIIIEGLKKK